MTFTSPLNKATGAPIQQPIADNNNHSVTNVTGAPHQQRRLPNRINDIQRIITPPPFSATAAREIGNRAVVGGAQTTLNNSNVPRPGGAPIIAAIPNNVTIPTHQEITGLLTIPPHPPIRLPAQNMQTTERNLVTAAPVHVNLLNQPDQQNQIGNRARVGKNNQS